MSSPCASHEELAEEARLAGGGIATEANSCRRARVPIPEDHLHRCSRPFPHRRRFRTSRDTRVPAAHSTIRRPSRPLRRAAREGLAESRRPLLRDRCRGSYRPAPRDPRFRAYRRTLLEPLELGGEHGGVDAFDHLAEHLDQAAVRVEQEMHGCRRRLVNRGVVQPEIQDRLHHSRHRDRPARADRNEQRVGRIAEALPGATLERREMLVDLARSSRGSGPACSEVTSGTPPSSR